MLNIFNKKRKALRPPVAPRFNDTAEEVLEPLMTLPSVPPLEPQSMSPDKDASGPASSASRYPTLSPSPLAAPTYPEGSGIHWSIKLQVGMNQILPTQKDAYMMAAAIGLHAASIPAGLKGVLIICLFDTNTCTSYPADGKQEITFSGEHGCSIFSSALVLGCRNVTATFFHPVPSLRRLLFGRVVINSQFVVGQYQLSPPLSTIERVFYNQKLMRHPGLQLSLHDGKMSVMVDDFLFNVKHFVEEWYRGLQDESFHSIPYPSWDYSSDEEVIS